MTQMIHCFSERMCALSNMPGMTGSTSSRECFSSQTMSSFAAENASGIRSKPYTKKKCMCLIPAAFRLRKLESYPSTEWNLSLTLLTLRLRLLMYNFHGLRVGRCMVDLLGAKRAKSLMTNLGATFLNAESVVRNL